MHQLRIEGRIVIPGLKLSPPAFWGTDVPYVEVYGVTDTAVQYRWQNGDNIEEGECPLLTVHLMFTLYREDGKQERPVSNLKTPFTHPNHPTVGHYFGGYGPASTNYATRIYYCDSYDPNMGFWLTSVIDPSDRKNVSERAIGRTFHDAEDKGDHFHIHQWGTRIDKDTGTEWPSFGTPGFEERMAKHRQWLADNNK